MELFENISAERERIADSIKKFGYAPEHNVVWYECGTEKGQTPIFVRWPDGTALITYKENDEWYVYSEPIASEDIGAQRVFEFVSYAFEKYPIKKVWLELSTPLRRNLLALLKDSPFRAHTILYTLTWPVMNMESFDVQLPGGHFKEIRNAKNKFYREHAVEVVPAVSVPKEALHKIIDIWPKRRKATDTTYRANYHAGVDRGFEGMDSARVLVVDGNVVGFNAGWEIVNSDKCYYGAIGLHDYSLSDLGVILYIEDLEWIKHAGYKTADMAGGEKNLTKFKNQFQPERWYKTFVFSVAKKKD